MKILIFGLGGVGGFVGGALANSYADTYFYARNATKETIERNGLRLDSKKLGNILAKPKVVSNDPKELGPMDIIILACKGDKLKEACQCIAPMVRSSTVVIPLLNGIVISNKLAQYLPSCIIADGIIRIFSHIEGPGHIVQDGGPCDIQIGMKDGNNPDALYELAKLLNQVGIDTKVIDTIVLESWKKLAITGTMSAILCYYQGTPEFVRTQDGYEQIVREAHHEVGMVAKAEGIEIPQNYLDKLVDIFMKVPGNTITSLYRDFLQGKSAKDTELETLIGDVVHIGKSHDLCTPIFEKAYNNYKDR